MDLGYDATNLGNPREHRLSYGRIILLGYSLAEVIIDEGIEMDLAMVEHYHQFLLKHLRAPFSLLVNKRNRYSYSFAAQAHLANLTEIEEMAVVAYDHGTKLTTQGLASTPRAIPWKLQIFDSRAAALNWLLSLPCRP